MANPTAIAIELVPATITRLLVQVAWGLDPIPVDAATLAKLRERFEVYAWAWGNGDDVEGEAELHGACAQGYAGFCANLEEPYDAHGSPDSPYGHRWQMPTRYLDALPWDGPLALTTTPRFASDMSAWQRRGACYMVEVLPLETGVGMTEAVEFAESWGWPIELQRPCVQCYTTEMVRREGRLVPARAQPRTPERPDPYAMNVEAETLGVGGVPYVVEQALDDAGREWLDVMAPTITRPMATAPPTNGGGDVDEPKWHEKGYPGGPMVKVKGFPRALYPPDAAPGHTPSKDGPDVVAYKRTVSRAGRWEWQKFDDSYSDNFAHGKAGGNVGESGVAGVQRQQKIQATGWIGETTFNTLRSIRIPEGLPHAGEPAMDATAADLINEAYDLFKAPSGDAARQKCMDHHERRVGYTEQPDGSNCDNRSDGIRTAQDHTAGGGTWLRYEPWCGCWCYYGLEAAGVQKIDSHLASVASIEDYAKQGAKCYRGWTTDRSKIKKGDLVVVGGYGGHVETVRGPAQADGGVPTYGGNTSPGSSGSQSNGGGAYKRVRYPSEVRGFALVRYPGE